MARRRAVIELIRQRGEMQPVSLGDVKKVCAYTSSGSASSLMQAMEREGIINAHKVKDGVKVKNAYTINDVPALDELMRNTVSVAALPVKRPYTPPRPELVQPTLSNEALAVRNLVLEYFWKKQNDSLRQFVQWLESGNK